MESDVEENQRFVSKVGGKLLYTNLKYKTLISEVQWASNGSLVEGSQRLATPLDNQELLPGTDLRPRLHSS